MNQKKNIEEMAKVICGLNRDCNTCNYSYDVYFIEKRPCSSMKYAEALYNKDYRKQREARWMLHPDGSGTCTECGTNQKHVWDFDNYQNYCGSCGAIMKGCD